MRRRLTRAALGLIAAALLPATAGAHPHVFIDGGVDFRLGEGQRLEALEVTWLYDEFETLYMLAAHDMGLNAAGGLDEADRQTLEQRLSDWPADFDGSAHLSVAGAPVPLVWPEALDVQLVDGRLQLRFLRRLTAPLDLQQQGAEVGFYESTYFFDFTLTRTPQFHGPEEGCRAQVIPFDPDSADKALLAALAELDREETSEIENVGAAFADRILLRCGDAH